MKFVGLCLFVVVGLSDAYPKTRSGYYPRGYMMGGSFYTNPRYVRQESGYQYPGQMTTMVVGDTVATNSFSGPALSYGPPVAHPETDAVEIDDEEVAEYVTEKQQPVVVPDSLNETDPELSDEQDILVEDVTTVAVPTTKAPKKVTKSKKPVAKPQPVDDDDDDEEQSAWPFGGAGRAGIPNYNAFFPIFIGGKSGRSRTRSTNEEESIPGSATAIANAFSTGKGGVATSHATSFGDPYAAAMMRNAGLFNFRTKNGKKPVVLQEDEE